MCLCFCMPPFFLFLLGYQIAPCFLWFLIVTKINNFSPKNFPITHTTLFKSFVRFLNFFSPKVVSKILGVEMFFACPKALSYRLNKLSTQLHFFWWISLKRSCFSLLLFNPDWLLTSPSTYFYLGKTLNLYLVLLILVM